MISIPIMAFFATVVEVRAAQLKADGADKLVVDQYYKA